MALTDYNYSLLNDFPNQAVDTSALDAEIRAESNITTDLDGVAYDGQDTVTCTFVDPLSAPEEAALDAVIGQHQGAPLVSTPQRVNSLPLQDNSDTAWQDAATLAPGSLQGGDWQVAWYSEIQMSSQGNNTGVQARLLVDGVERALTTNDLEFWQAFSGAGLLQFQDGDAPVITMQFRRIGQNNTAQIRRVQISLILEQ